MAMIVARADDQKTAQRQAVTEIDRVLDGLAICLTVSSARLSTVSDGIRAEIAGGQLWEDGTRVAMDYSW